MQCKVVECSVCRWLERLVASSCPRDSYSLVNSSTTPLFNLKSMGMVACRISKSAQVCEAKQKLQGWRGQFVILRGKLMMGPLGQPKEVKGTPTTATRWLNTEKEFFFENAALSAFLAAILLMFDDDNTTGHLVNQNILQWCWKLHCWIWWCLKRCMGGGDRIARWGTNGTEAPPGGCSAS